MSILAATACDSINPEDLVFNGHASNADDLLGSSICVESHSLFKVTTDQLQHSSKDLCGISEI